MSTPHTGPDHAGPDRTRHDGGRLTDEPAVAHRPGERRRDAVTALFAAALAGDPTSHDALRAAAKVDDRAADALWALATADAETDLRDPATEPARTAATDQLLAFLRPHLAEHLAEHRDQPHQRATPE